MKTPKAKKRTLVVMENPTEDQIFYWAHHELNALEDPLCRPYSWVPKCALIEYARSVMFRHKPSAANGKAKS